MPELDVETLGEIIFESGPDDCTLPCWNGLEIGISTLDDLSVATQRAFEFDALRYPSPEGSRAIAGYDRYGYRWEFYEDERYYGDFRFIAWYNEDTELLEGLDFYLTIYRVERRPNVNSQRLLQEIGLPSEWFVDFEPGGQGTDGYHIRFPSIMYYDSGISFYQYYEIPAKPPTPQDSTQVELVDFCLSEYTSFSLLLREPLASATSSDDLSSLQQPITQHIDYSSIEEALGVSPEDILQCAQEGDVCLTVELPISEE